jgi:pilus assembly protein CpaF
MFRVQVFKADDLVGEAISPHPACFLGKDSGSLVPLRGWRIGRKQVQFDLREGALFLKDGGGLTPIKVNGNVVHEHGPLASNDTIDVGDYRLRVNVTERPPRKVTPLVKPQPESASADAPTVPGRKPVAAISPLEAEQGMELRGLLHRRLIEAMDLRRVNVSRMGDAELRTAVQKLIDELIETDPAFVTLSSDSSDSSGKAG